MVDVISMIGIIVLVAGALSLVFHKAFPGKGTGVAVGLILVVAGLAMNYSFFASLELGGEGPEQLRGEYNFVWSSSTGSSNVDTSTAVADSATLFVTSDLKVLRLYDSDTNFDDDSSGTTSVQFNATVIRAALPGEETTNIETITLDVNSVDIVTLTGSADQPIFAYDDATDSYTITWGGTGVSAGPGSTATLGISPGDQDSVTMTMSWNEDAFTNAVVSQYTCSWIAAGSILTVEFVVTANSV